jgi:hypothetical protein
MTPRKIQSFPEIVIFPVAVQYKPWASGVSKPWVSVVSLVGIAGSNSAAGVDICVLCVLFVVG